MPYFTLITRDADGTWFPQFGDYDRNVVKEEVTEYRSEYRAKDVKVIRCDDESLAALDRAIAALG